MRIFRMNIVSKSFHHRRNFGKISHHIVWNMADPALQRICVERLHNLNCEFKNLNKGTIKKCRIIQVDQKNEVVSSTFQNHKVEDVTQLRTPLECQKKHREVTKLSLSEA